MSEWDVMLVIIGVVGAFVLGFLLGEFAGKKAKEDELRNKRYSEELEKRIDNIKSSRIWDDDLDLDDLDNLEDEDDEDNL